MFDLFVKVCFFSMGDLQGWLPRADGVAGELNPAPASPPAVENPHPMVIESVRWRRAENATGAIIERIQPTRVSEDRRRAVVDYVQRLVKHFTGSEVILSTPLLVKHFAVFILHTCSVCAIQFCFILLLIY